jgi:hypothetical protein
MTPTGPIVVDKFGGSVLTRPEDVAAAVEIAVRQRAAGLRPVVVVSAFGGHRRHPGVGIGLPRMEARRSAANAHPRIRPWRAKRIAP